MADNSGTAPNAGINESNKELLLVSNLAYKTAAGCATGAASTAHDNLNNGGVNAAPTCNLTATIVAGADLVASEKKLDAVAEAKIADPGEFGAGKSLLEPAYGIGASKVKGHYTGGYYPYQQISAQQVETYSHESGPLGNDVESKKNCAWKLASFLSC